MKLLIINTVPTEKNGITNVIFNLYPSMIKMGLNIDLMTINNPSYFYTDIIEKHGGKIYTFPRSSRHPIKYIRGLKNILDGYDAVHVHGNSASMVFEMIAAKSAKISNRIIHSHSTSTNNPILHKILRPFLRRMSTIRLSCSQESGLWTYGTHDFKVIANSIEVSKYAFNSAICKNLRQQYGVEDKTVVYGHVGGFYSEKNHDFLIDVFHNIQKKNPNTLLVLVGDGPLKESIEKKVENLGLTDKVIFTGSIDNVFEYLNMFDVFIFPSLHEGFGIAPLEAQANGLPVIAAKDNVPEAVKATCSLEFLPLDIGAEKWAEKISMVNMIRNPNASQEIISAGYDITASVEVLKKIYTIE